jgi:antitoxin component YwqK of YwqJK toxin-antitoxin module
MRKKGLYLIIFLVVSLKLKAQNEGENIVYIVDNIVVIEDPEYGNEIIETDISDINVLKNKDSLKAKGFEKFQGAIYIYTKEFKKRTAELKKIPSTKQMERKDGVFYFNNQIYNGKFIDYYYSGKIQGEGFFKNGKVDGLRKMYFQNGNLSVERFYTNAIENGLEKEYYEDGTLKQKGMFLDGKENGVWESYFPNGKVKQRTSFKNGIVEGESITYYSSGKILSVKLAKYGKLIPDERLEKITQLMNKSDESYQNMDFKSAIKYCDKAIEIDSEYAQAYFARGTLKLNQMLFDESITDFDQALKIEPFMTFALSNRAFARIRKHQFQGDKTLFKSSDVTVLSSKKEDTVPEVDKEKICNDLKAAIFLGDKSEMVIEAKRNYCK